MTRDCPPIAKSFNKIANRRQRALEEILGMDFAIAAIVNWGSSFG